jgi:ABC-type proline/glycine betaine transport system ATPase subunit
VRLAFAVMVEADADIMLVDEVLAVGDAAFAQKCMDVFREKRRAGKTIVLVTHDMTTVQTLCHRAMLLHDGELRFIGAPEDAALAYYRMNFASEDHEAAAGAKRVDVNARIVTATAPESVAEGEPIALDVVLEAARPLTRPHFIFHVRNEEGTTVFELTRPLDAALGTGRQVTLAGSVQNPLLPGNYTLDLYIREPGEEGATTVQGLRLLHFTVTGSSDALGMVSVEADIEPVVVE